MKPTIRKEQNEDAEAAASAPATSGLTDEKKQMVKKSILRAAMVSFSIHVICFIYFSAIYFWRAIISFVIRIDIFQKIKEEDSDQAKGM